jgi:hypothetical protein
MFLRDTLCLSDPLAEEDQEEKQEQREGADGTKQPESSGKVDPVCGRQPVEADIEREYCASCKLWIEASRTGLDCEMERGTYMT